MSASLPLDDPEPIPSRPACHIFAGPPGSGKSGLKADLEAQGQTFDRHIDAGDIARAIGNDGAENNEAGNDEAKSEEADTRRRADVVAAELRRRCMMLGEDFSFETDLAAGADLELMRKAKEEGFQVFLHFVGLQDPSLNRARLESRARRTGESVCAGDIHSRYWQIMRQLADAAWIADRTYLFDNSHAGRERTLVAECQGGTITLYADPAPGWAKTFFIEPLAGPQ